MKRLTLKFLCLCAGLLVFNTMYAQTFDTTVTRVMGTFDNTTGQLGEYNQMLIVNGNPAIFTYSSSRQALVYVRATNASGTVWGDPILIDSTNSVAGHISAAIVNGNPAVCYRIGGSNNDLMYVRAANADGSSWNTPVTVDATGVTGEYSSLAIINGNPAISYYNSTNQDLYYVRATNVDGTSWGTPVVVESTNTVGLYTSLAVVDGNPAISFYGVSNSELKYVRATDASGTTWGTSLTLESANTVGYYSRLIVVNDTPSIAYHIVSGRDLKYIRATDKTGSAWGTGQTVLSSGNVGEYLDIAIVGGYPSISAYNSTSDDLLYVRAADSAGSSWSSSVTALSTDDIGRYTSMIVVNDTPAIACYDLTNTNLTYVRATDAIGSTWGTPVSFDISGQTGTYNSMILIAGKPAMVYYNASITALEYVYANDTAGSSWGTPIVIDNTAIVGQYAVLAIANGNPAIAYWDQTNRDLKYVRATDATGSTWGTPLTLDTNDNNGIEISMAIINGNPAIAYKDYSNSKVRYIRATDASGSAWAAYVVPDAVGSQSSPSLCEVQGYPAIAFQDNTNADLKYIRATDSIGSSWATSQIIDATGSTGYAPSLKIINGYPAVAFRRFNESIKYIRANDSTGNNWGSVVAVPTTKNVLYQSFIEVNNKPAICYFDYTATGSDRSFHYIYATDPLGNNWAATDTLAKTDGSNMSMLTDSNNDHIYVAFYNNIDKMPYIAHGTFPNNIWNGSTWSEGTPDTITIAKIASSTAPASFSCKDLIINSGVSLNTGTSNTVTIYGDLINEGDGLTGTGTVTFTKDGTTYITGDTLGFGGTITVASGCTLSTEDKLRLTSDTFNTGRIGESAGTITGDVMAQRYSIGKRCYRLYAHPFSSSIALSQLTDEIDITGTGGATNGFTATQTNASSAYWFDPTTADTTTSSVNSGWKAFTSAISADWDRHELLLLYLRGAKGEGLNGAAYTPSASTFEASGTVNQGTQVVTLTKGASTNFAAVGNPFPSGVQMQDVTPGANVGANYYAWDASVGADGAYVTNAFTLPYVLPAYAGFFTTISATTDITFEEADKAAGGAGLFKTTAPQNWVELIISDSNTKWDRLLINLDATAMDVEDNKDAKKLYNPNLDFYTLSKDNAKLAIDVRPFTDNSTIPLGINAYNRYNKYVIKVGDWYDIPAGAKLVLHDKYLNKTEELKPGAAYWFNVTTDSLSQGDKRFEINMVGAPTTGIEQTARKAQMQLVPNPAHEQVKVSFDRIEGTATVTMTSITGQVIYHQSVNTQTGSVIIPLQQVPAGMYIIELQSDNARFTEKLIKE